MFAVIDIDCSLYSYSELARSQRLHVFSLLAARAGGPRPLHRAADRVFEKYAASLGGRLRFLESFFGAGGARLYTSYPLTEGKLRLLSSFSLPFDSSHPREKSAEEIRRLCRRSPDLIIGDRAGDRDLARDLGAFWAGCPFYDRRHLLSGASYTEAFAALVKKAAAQSAGIKNPG